MNHLQAESRWFSGRSLSNGLFEAGTAALCIVASIALAGLCFVLHVNLSTAGSLELLLVVLVALRSSFFHAFAVSITAMACLNYLFVPPLFSWSVADARNWVSLVAFEGVALVVSGIADKMRLNASAIELERKRNSTLYELSRAILLIDGRQSTVEQVSALVRELLQVDAIWLWVLHDIDPGTVSRYTKAENDPAHAAYLAGLDRDDEERGTTQRILRIGTTPIGAMTLQGWRCDPLLADSVASLVAVALERARALQKENRAEAARNTEQLRTAVLDGLAHGFKTPLTAIQTASSGLLAISQLRPIQLELVSIIDDQAMVLAQMTTQLLQTAALDAREIRLRRTRLSIISLLQDVIHQQNDETQLRIKISATAEMAPIHVDASIMKVAISQLLDNAAKYALVGHNIEISITQDESETMIVVANEGLFIRHEERERIFERFYRGLESTYGPTGTGLGLSIVKKSAEAHGGRVWVECEGNMNRFSLAIPHYEGARE